MKEKEIRPKKLFKKFLNLAAQDVKKFFKSKNFKINCIACKAKGEFSFKKKDFSYCICPKCKTLYVNPRPSEQAFLNYYTKSSSIKFLANTLYKKTKEERRKKIWIPKTKIILEKLKKNNIKKCSYIDIGGGYGTFAEEMSKRKKDNIVVIEPSPFMAQECRKKKLQVIQKFLESVEKKELPNKKKVFTCFELIEHLYNPSKFIKNMRKLMNKEDLFIFTTLSSTGVDILTLWNNSRSVNPPHHINFFNPKSIAIFLKKHGFKIVDISTPGKLDIDILENDKLFIQDRFWRAFLMFAKEKDKIKMQNLISDLNFSSHMMVTCKRQ
jgi:2-polyprenyl-3-methyl-5-hydroxy-6-metoxy-1,4-benzoquinol methylase